MKIILAHQSSNNKSVKHRLNFQFCPITKPQKTHHINHMAHCYTHMLLSLLIFYMLFARLIDWFATRNEQFFTLIVIIVTGKDMIEPQARVKI